MLSENGSLLRIYVGETEKHDGVPLYQYIVRQARDHKLAGATVMRAVEGYGAHSKIHSVKLLDLAMDLPMIVEIVDEQEKIEAFLDYISSFFQEGLATVEKVHIRLYRFKPEEKK
jgi:PII-like signaling protein